MKNFIFALATAAVLGGCFANGFFGNDALAPVLPGQVRLNYYDYLENNGTLGKIAFYSENLSKTMRLQDGDVVGLAITQISGRAVKLGDMLAIGGFTATLHELDADMPFGYCYVDLKDRAEFERVSRAKSLKFYQFGGGIIESSVFYAKGKAVCESFNSGKAIDVRVVTNYYDKQSEDNSKFFATIMDIHTQKGGPATIKNLDFRFFYPQDETEKLRSQAKSRQFKSLVIEPDAAKQEQILEAICAQPK